MRTRRVPLNYRRQSTSRSELRWGWAGVISFSFSFFIFFMLHIASLVPTVSIALVLFVALLMLFSYPASTLLIIIKEYFILIPAALCLLSTVWSQYPAQTLYYGVQFAVVAVIGVHMAYWHRSGTIIGFMSACLAYLLISVVAQNRVAWLNQGASIEVGINGGKSYIGAIASTGALAAIFSILHGLKLRKLLFIYSGVFCLCVAFVAIIAARASGALVGLFVNTIAFFVLLWLSRQSHENRAKTLIVILPIAVLCSIFGSEIWAATLEFFNKSTDLTGRVFLWERAGVAIDTRPWLGTGFNGFWVVGNPDAEVLWNYAAIKGKAGFNFHNTFLEFAVSFGLPLAIVLCIIYIIAIFRAISLALTTGDHASIFGATVLIDWISHAAFESGGLGTFSSSLLLLYFSLSGTRIPRLASPESAPSEASRGGLPKASH